MKSYLRYLWRNRLYSTINLVGLTVALALSIIIFSYAAAQMKIARSVPDGENIYAVCKDNQTLMCYGMADLVRSSIPEAEAVTRFTASWDGEISMFGDRKYNTFLMSADKEFFGMFDVKFIAGGPEAFNSLTNVIISESFAGKIAGEDKDVIGKPLIVNDEPYTIAGIVEDFGDGLLKYTDVITNIESERFNSQYREYPWSVFGPIQTFFRTAQGSDISAVESKIRSEYRHKSGSVSDFGIQVSIVCLDDLYFHPGNFYLNAGNAKAIRNLALAGIALLVSALFNYINLNTALAGKRAREMATRRLLGSGRKDIILKYIGESSAFTVLCFALAVVLAAALVPAIDWLITDPSAESSTMGMSVKDIFTPAAFLSYIGLVAAVSVIAGIIPALIASRYSPVDVVKGTIRFKSKMVFSKVFIVVQNMLSVVLIALAITMEAQMRYMTGRPAGCDFSDVYYLCTDFMEQDGFRLAEKLRSLPCVESVGICDYLPGAMGTTFTASDKDGNDVPYHPMRCDTTAFNMLGFDILEQYGQNIPGAVWLSESTARTAGVSAENTDISSIKKGYSLRGTDNYASGVVRDFIIQDAGASEKMENGIIFIVRPEDLWYFSYVIKTTGDRDEAEAMITGAHNELCEEVFGVAMRSWQCGYMEDILENSLDSAKRNMRLIEIFMVMAIILSLSGLVAISIFYADSNRKSIALHKVFGGTVGSETGRNIRIYMIMTVIADIVAVPAAVILCRRYLEEFAYRIDLGAWIFIVTTALSLLMTAASVLWQVCRAARTDPADALKTE